MRTRPKQVGGPENGPTNALTNAKYIAINAFLIFHILAIACWCLPIDSPLISLCKNGVRPYFLWSGLFQSWDMFSPIPKSANTYIEATIVFKDGSRTTWTFPRMEQLSLTERYFKERYRKFAETLPLDQNDALLPDVARRIARLEQHTRASGKNRHAGPEVVVHCSPRRWLLHSRALGPTYSLRLWREA